MRRAACALVLIITSAACDPGPLPPVVDLGRLDPNDAFPASSIDPLPIDNAIMSGDLEGLRRLLAQGMNPNARWSYRGDRLPIQAVLESPMYRYPISDRAQFLILLLRHGADPNARWCPFESRGSWGPGRPRCTTDTASSALHFAAALGDRESVQLLLDAGADPRRRNWGRGSPLDCAHDEIVFESISRAMFPNVATRDQQALAWISEYGGNPYLPSPWASMPLMRALEESDGHYISTFAGPTSNDYVESVWFKQRSLSRLRILLRIGANPNERVGVTGFDWPPLAMALGKREYRAAQVLLAGGADVNLRWCAASAPRNDVLIAPTNHPACTVSEGRTALMWSSAIGDREAVKLLLEFKADRSLRDWAGRSALDYATHPDIRKLLN